MALSDKLLALYAGTCTAACDWLDASGHTTLQEAWDASPNGEWMLFALGIQAGVAYGSGRRSLARMAGDIAKLSIGLSSQAEKATSAIDYAQSWGMGDDSKTEAGVIALMAEMEVEEPDDIEDAYLVPLYVITGEDNEELALDLQRMAGVYAQWAVETPAGKLTTKRERYLEVADIVRSYFPTVPVATLS